MPGMDGFINFNGTLEGSIAGGGGGDVTDVKVRNSQETTFESVVNEDGIAEIDLISYVRRNELTQAIENIENSIDNVEQLVDTKQNKINYSTEEQVIGTYLGKPLYQKTHVLNSPIDVRSNAWEFVDVGISNIECIITNEIVDNIGNSVNTFIVSLENASSTRVALGNAGRLNITGVKRITLWYTKTTD